MFVARYDIPNHGSIYLPAVQVFRDGEARAGYQLVKAPRKVSFLLASSVEKPKSEAKGRSFVLEASARSDLEAKVTAILSAGIEKASKKISGLCLSCFLTRLQGHDAIVFTAFGCGFNQAPPQGRCCRLPRFAHWQVFEHLQARHLCHSRRRELHEGLKEEKKKTEE
jgi:hypothetical protein